MFVRCGVVWLLSGFTVFFGIWLLLMVLVVFWVLLIWLVLVWVGFWFCIDGLGFGLLGWVLGFGCFAFVWLVVVGFDLGLVVYFFDMLVCYYFVVCGYCVECVCWLLCFVWSFRLFGLVVLGCFGLGICVWVGVVGLICCCIWIVL